MSNRTTKQTIILGFNGTGKSTLTRKIIETYVAKPGRKALIITPDSAEWTDYPETELKRPSDFQFEGIRRYIWTFIQKEDQAAMQRLRDFYFDGFLAFDDCRSYLMASTNDWLKYLYIRRRQKKIDLLLIAHGFTDVPPQAFTNCTDLFLFKTVDNIIRRKDELRNLDDMIRHQERINQKAETNPHYYERIKFS
ncbi:MAG: hypothetical protein AB7U05_09020 [Mangrovibacterium sp.]